MHVQPKLLTVIIANEDLARTYTTIHSVQSSRYRNHEVVGIIPYHLEVMRRHIARDFPWMPLITAPYAGLSTLLQEVRERAQISHVDAVLFIQAGTTLNPETIHDLVSEMNRHPEHDIIMPATTRADGSGVVYGATQPGKWPHQLKSIITLPPTALREQAHFVGGVCLVRAAMCLRHRFNDSADDLALLYWIESLLQRGIHSFATPAVTVFFDGTLYSDFSDIMLVPESWYRDAKRFVARQGSWYDRVEFALRFGWRKDSSLFARMVEVVSPHRPKVIADR